MARQRFYLFATWFGLLLAVCYWPVIGNITHQWSSDEDMGHGYFVPLIAGYIVWERKDELFAQPFHRDWLGLALLAAGALLALVGSLGAEIFMQRVALMISLYGVVLYFMGRAAVRIILFPLLLLVFMLPIPGIVYKSITFPLQLLASRLAETGLELLGYMVLREGNILELAGQQLSVVEACSGVRALLSLSFFSLAYSYFFSPEVWIRWAMLAATVPIAVAANASRIIVTGIVGEYSQEMAQGFFHGMSGWVIFVVAIALLVLIHKCITGLAVRLSYAPVR
jgi:exosortase